MSEDNTVLTLDTSDDDCGEIDFKDMATTVRTPEESAEVRARRSRQDAAAGIAYNGALASGYSVAYAKHAAARARKETL